MVIVAGTMEIGRHHIDEVAAILAATGFDHLVRRIRRSHRLVDGIERPGQDLVLAQRLLRQHPTETV
jgi:hypothetical protein